MMNIKQFFGMALISVSLIACDDNTDTLGNSLTNTADQFETLTDTFQVKTRSIAVDSVLSRSQFSYLGHIKDPETGANITSHYTTQFSILPTISTFTLFPPKDSIASLNANGEVIADSCFMNIHFYSSVGDTLNPMKLTLMEMSAPVEDGQSYYTDFDPEAKGLIRSDGIRINMPYTIVNLNLSDSMRNFIVSNANLKYIEIPLNKEYTDRDGRKYNNYGSYLMSKYYENDDNYKSSYSFAHNVCPGFYIKSSDGLGVMSKVYITELSVYYRYKNDSIFDGGCTLSGTEEVLQTINMINDKSSVDKMIADESCTYLKSPAGIFTEVDIPVDSIMNGHETDSLSSVKIVFNRLNPTMESFINAPTNVLMLPKDSLYSFFEDKNLPDNIHSYIAVNNASYGTYTFNNISALVSSMFKVYSSGKASADWNKVVLIPVSVETSSNSSSSATITNVSHDMSLTSTRLIGGEANKRSPITVSVIYNRFDKK